jgi:hypothetical protein
VFDETCSNSVKSNSRAAAEGSGSTAYGGLEGELHKFDINFVTLRVRAIRNVPVRMMNIRETVITDTHIMYQTFPQRSEDAKLLYLVETPPKQGVLLLSQADFSQQSMQPKKLKSGSRFTQADLLSGHLKYRLSRKAYVPVEDQFTFVVQTGRGLKSAVQTLQIHHIPGDADVDITLESLEVEEGAKKAVTNKYLDIRASDGRHFVFNVTKTPRHGQGRNSTQLSTKLHTLFCLLPFLNHLFRCLNCAVRDVFKCVASSCRLTCSLPTRLT